jgi:ferredoxin-type protein NapG
MASELSRRNLFRLRPVDYLQLFREATSPASREIQSHHRPPGAVSDEASFLTICERCHACSSACPHGVIEHLGPIAGNAEGTPILHPETNPCRWCPDMDCIRACPSGALSFRRDGTVPPIAKVRLNPASCLNEQGILCDTCVMHCPPSVRALSLVSRKPQLNPDACTGCGLCAFHCEASPGAFTIHPSD